MTEEIEISAEAALIILCNGKERQGKEQEERQVQWT
jgi:hypothetical protein